MLSGDGVLRTGARPVDLVIRRGADPASPAVWRLRDGRAGRGNETLP